MYENILFPNLYLDNWQMSPAERITMTGILAQLKPKGALEVGVYYGGSLSLTSQFAQHVIGIDIDPVVRDRFNCPSNAEIWIGDSETGIPSAFSHFERAGIPLNFILVDADHSPAGVARDLGLILRYEPREPLVLLMHDSGNPGCREGILSVDWASNPHLHEVEVDFVPGQIPEHSVKDGRGEIWGGLALAYFDPTPRTGPPMIRQSAATSLSCLRFLVNDLRQLPTTPSGEVRLVPGAKLRPGHGLASVLQEGWASPEDWGVWSIGSRAVMRVAFGPAVIFPAILQLNLVGFVAPGMTQSVNISIGERNVKTVNFHHGIHHGTMPDVEPIRILRTDVSQDLRAEIVFDISTPASPAKFGLSDDRRDLGVGIMLLELL
jgi:hypothetical protein